ncbi:hypothetical protein Cob_v011777 [Colletotrichum orbiculare MAFF 240422]|uniref:Uncharacterized protein n=1 Tax=Colletotrichum orbiculare (strain 104-T / ATCC 96160 / CBS 514.97 / LARS 414 / MAFF 240422) TaxID=1213857 RepID=N4UNM2_COLOR|nr:hypothetical protein Cob_v011777 [Colletotrichum orbiculare MAFF 240422]
MAAQNPSSNSNQEITVMWKGNKPKQQFKAEITLKACWMTLLQQNGGVPTDFVVRAPLHDTTRTGRGFKKDDWHVTASFKPRKTTISTAHGYTTGEYDSDVVRSTVRAGIPANACNVNGVEIWPSGKGHLVEVYTIGFFESLLEKNWDEDIAKAIKAKEEREKRRRGMFRTQDLRSGLKTIFEKKE